MKKEKKVISPPSEMGVVITKEFIEKCIKDVERGRIELRVAVFLMLIKLRIIILFYSIKKLCIIHYGNIRLRLICLWMGIKSKLTREIDYNNVTVKWAMNNVNKHSRLLNVFDSGNNHIFVLYRQYMRTIYEIQLVTLYPTMDFCVLKVPRDKEKRKAWIKARQVKLESIKAELGYLNKTSVEPLDVLYSIISYVEQTYKVSIDRNMKLGELNYRYKQSRKINEKNGSISK